MLEKYEVCIHGLGYVGLPLLLATSRCMVTCGVDVNEEHLKTIKSKALTIEDCTIAQFFGESDLTLDSTPHPAEIHVICVPTPVLENKLPDTRPLEAALTGLQKLITKDDVIIIESTVYPGLLRELVEKILGSWDEFNIVHCPERINPGDKSFGLLNIDRVLGANNSNALEIACEFYEKILPNVTIHKLKSVEAAEATKVTENIFRDVNIALVNEMAQAFYRMGIDVYEVLDAASTKPFGFLKHTPGLGVGGHCIAVDPYYMIEKGKASGFDHEFLRLARKINENMPTYMTNYIQNVLNEHGRAVSKEKIVILGLAYKPNVSDDRESPSYVLRDRLINYKKASVKCYDAHVPHNSDFANFDEAIEWSTVIVIATGHEDFLAHDWSKIAEEKIVFDGRGVLKSQIIVKNDDSKAGQTTKMSKIYTLGDGSWEQR